MKRELYKARVSYCMAASVRTDRRMRQPTAKDTVEEAAQGAQRHERHGQAPNHRLEHEADRPPRIPSPHNADIQM